VLAWVRIAGRYIRYRPSMLRSLHLPHLNLFANRVQPNAWRGESVNALDIRNDGCRAAVTCQAITMGGARRGTVNPTDSYAQLMAIGYLSRVDGQQN
jgi:hypothetical protein